MYYGQIRKINIFGSKKVPLFGAMNLEIFTMMMMMIRRRSKCFTSLSIVSQFGMIKGDNEKLSAISIIHHLNSASSGIPLCLHTGAFQQYEFNAKQNFETHYMLPYFSCNEI